MTGPSLTASPSGKRRGHAGPLLGQAGAGHSLAQMFVLYFSQMCAGASYLWTEGRCLQQLQQAACPSQGPGGVTERKSRGGTEKTRAHLRPAQTHLSGLAQLDPLAALPLPEPYVRLRVPQARAGVVNPSGPRGLCPVTTALSSRC